MAMATEKLSAINFFSLVKKKCMNVALKSLLPLNVDSFLLAMKLLYSNEMNVLATRDYFLPLLFASLYSKKSYFKVCFKML